MLGKTFAFKASIARTRAVDDGERMLKPEVLRLPWMFILEHMSLLWSEADPDEILRRRGIVLWSTRSPGEMQHLHKARKLFHRAALSN